MRMKFQETIKFRASFVKKKFNLMHVPVEFFHVGTTIKLSLRSNIHKLYVPKIPDFIPKDGS